MSDTKAHISVCVVTYKRPELLKKLLDGLLKQKTAGLFVFSVVVVDNDKDLSAFDVAERFKDNPAGIGIAYYSQPIKNISLARNMSIEKSSGEYVACIDDDEYPGEDWLFNLYSTMTLADVDIVHGPVVYYFAEGVRTWIKATPFFQVPPYKTGEVRYYVMSTNNCLVRKSVFDRYVPPFAEKYGLTGGEDWDFFQRLRRDGVVSCWCAEAITHEYVPLERTSVKWMIKRAYRLGQSNYEPLVIAKNLLWRCCICMYIIAILVIHLFFFVPALVRSFFDPGYFYLYLWRAVFYVGGIGLCFNVRCYEYGV